MRCHFCVFSAVQSCKCDKMIEWNDRLSLLRLTITRRTFDRTVLGHPFDLDAVTHESTPHHFIIAYDVTHTTRFTFMHVCGLCVSVVVFVPQNVAEWTNNSRDEGILWERCKNLITTIFERIIRTIIILCINYYYHLLLKKLLFLWLITVYYDLTELNWLSLLNWSKLLWIV